MQDNIDGALIAQQMDERISIVNKIIIAIAQRGRKFFEHKEKVAYIFRVNSTLFMRNEYNGIDMLLSSIDSRSPEGWNRGGTLLGLVKDFKMFIEHGQKCNGKHGYGGLFCPHWGYSDDEMNEIITIARSLGYL